MTFYEEFPGSELSQSFSRPGVSAAGEDILKDRLVIERDIRLSS